MIFSTYQQEKRFVIQQHSTPDGKFHFDIMFEEDNVLKTFQIEQIQKLMDGIKITGKNIQDHRIIYLDYEGEISGNRGYVKIFDKGYYILDKITDNHFKFYLKSSKLNGVLHINFIDIQEKIVEITYINF